MTLNKDNCLERKIKRIEEDKYKILHRECNLIN